MSRLTALAGCALCSLAIPASASAALHMGDRTLRTGSRGHDVRVLQDFLTRAGITTPITGYYGKITRGHVRSFERRQGLRADGVFTPSVSRVLRRVAGTRSNYSTSATGRAGLNSDGTASAPAGAPAAVRALIAAGNRIAFKPYIYGGGHASFRASGYDCSGSVSFALHGGGLLSHPLDSTGFESYGGRGHGRWVTVYANAGHAYMTVAGLRFDTSGRSGSGSRWQRAHRSSSGYVVRHPRGF